MPQTDSLDGLAAPASDDTAGEPASLERPFRLEAYDADDAEVRRLNEAEGHTHGRAYETTLQTLNRIRQTKGEVAPSRLAAWGRHPSEHVPIELLRRADPENRPGALLPVLQRSRRNTKLDWLWGEHDPHHARVALLARALREAEAEGMVWTPLLDALAEDARIYHRRGYWPTSSVYRDVGTSVPDEPDEAPAFRSPEEMLEPVEDWVARQEDGEVVDELLDHFQAVPLRAVVARQHPEPDEELTGRLLSRHPRLAPELASNPHLPTEEADRLHRAALEALRGEAFDWFQADTDVAQDTLAALHEHGHRTDPEFRNDLIDVLRHTRDQTSSGAGAASGGHRAALDLLVETDGLLRAPDLIDVWQALSEKMGRWPLRELAGHPEAGSALWKRMLEDSGRHVVREVIAGQEKALEAPEIREELADTSSGDMLATLYEAAPEGEGRESIFREMAKADRVRAYNTLKQADDLDDEVLDERYRYAVKRFIGQQPDQALEIIEKEDDVWLRRLGDHGPWIDKTMRTLARKQPFEAVAVLEEDAHPWLAHLTEDRNDLYRRAFRYQRKEDLKGALQMVCGMPAWYDEHPERAEMAGELWGDLLAEDPHLALRELDVPRRWTGDVVADLPAARRRAWLRTSEQAPGRAHNALTAAVEGDQDRDWLLALPATDFHPLIEQLDSTLASQLVGMLPRLGEDPETRSLLLARIEDPHDIGRTIWYVVQDPPIEPLEGPAGPAPDDVARFWVSPLLEKFAAVNPDKCADLLAGRGWPGWDPDNIRIGVHYDGPEIDLIFESPVEADATLGPHRNALRWLERRLRVIRHTGYREGEFAPLFEHLCRMSAADALRLLEDEPELMSHLTEEHLLPALRADDTEVRQRAMLLLSRVGASAPENDVPEAGSAGGWQRT